MAGVIAFNPIYLPQNKGLGNALREAILNCKFDLIARMDSDDISAPYRFEKELEKFKADPELDIVGGTMTEFEGDAGSITGERAVKLEDADIKVDMKKRCAMNHVAVMYKKEAIQNAGGYQEWHYNEDYYLWIRMIEHGCKFANISYTIVNVRMGADMIARRGGWMYFRSEQMLQKYMLNHGLITLPRYLYNVALRAGGELLAPNSARQWIFRIKRKRYDLELASGIETKRRVVTEEYPPFSVAISVYKKDNPEWFDIALASIINQTVKPSEIVLVVDGSVPDEIQKVIEKYERICEREKVLLKVIRFTENKGLGGALRTAIDNCSNELIARMDSDDIAVGNRFELQLKKFMTDQLDICGGQIGEFIGEPANVVGRRIVPETDEALKEYMKRRCPFNHMTVMYRKTAVLEAGSYQDWFWNEDYYLWIRMALKKQQFANVPETLVYARVGKDMYARRGGDKYFKSEMGIQKLMLEKRLIRYPVYLSNCAKRFVVQKIMPNKMRAWAFKKFARS